MPEYHLNQIRGVLLEESLAALLKGAGFRIVTSIDGDETLAATGAGIAVRGRGADHQIDVIGDFQFVSPFTNPLRLLVEAKFWKTRVGLPVIRNIAGVLRDVSEWFLPSSRTQANRYHYQAAVFSASAFSGNAQRFAYAHDIMLVPLGHNPLFKPVLDAIQTFSEIEEARENLRLRDVRSIARHALIEIGEPADSIDSLDRTLRALDRATRRIGSAYLARTRSGFPLFLVPESLDTVAHVPVTGEEEPMAVRYQRGEGWWLETTGVGQRVRFTFDLPEQLWRVFRENGRLDQREAIRMKREQFDAIHAYRYVGNHVETMILRLDRPWLESIEQALNQRDD